MYRLRDVSRLRRCVVLFIVLFLYPLQLLSLDSESHFSSISVPKNAGLYIFDVESGAEIFSRNATVPLKPASVLKILTAYTMLQVHDPYKRIPTEVLSRGASGSHIQTLYIRGNGDPQLTQENVWFIARKVRQRGVRSIGRIVVDDTRFIDAPSQTGQRAYQAGASALSFNFNSIGVEVCPSANGIRVAHEPREVPVQFSGKISQRSKKGGVFNVDRVSNAGYPLHFKLGGQMFRGSACEEVYRSVPDPALYLGYALSGYLEKEGIDIQSPVSKEKTPSGTKVFYTHYSKPLREAVGALNTFSNNMIAEQLVILAGKQSRDSYSHSAGLSRLADELVNVGASREDFALFDGSGLSHSNRITSKHLGMILQKALTHPEHKVEFEASLPVDSKSGTLKKRSYLGVVRAKTGTLTGVTSLAGALESKNGRKIGFVLLQNKVSSHAKASTLEKKVISRIYNYTL